MLNVSQFFDGELPVDVPATRTSLMIAYALSRHEADNLLRGDFPHKSSWRAFRKDYRCHRM